MSDIPEEPVSFEQALKELDLIVRALEDGGTALEEGLARYEQGVGLLKYCYGLLRQVEQRIQTLTAESEGQAVTAPFQHAATGADPSPQRKQG
jgi:exodeoxyribonuclease VII small subunit